VKYFQKQQENASIQASVRQGKVLACNNIAKVMSAFICQRISRNSGGVSTIRQRSNKRFRPTVDSL
jgi:hypothetical protein